MTAILSETVSLFHGDALQIMPITNQKVDLICTDPPYPLTQGGKKSGEMGGKFHKDTYANDGQIVESNLKWADFMQPLFESLHEGHAYIMFNNRHVLEALDEAQKAGFRFHNLLAWDKKTATPNRYYMKNIEFTGFFYKGPAKAINDCGSNQLISYPNIINGQHPTQKPVALMEHYIRNSTKPGDTVFDPFMGLGSTGIAALNLGRKFIGIEKDKSYFDIARERIEAAESNRQTDIQDILERATA